MSVARRIRRVLLVVLALNWAVAVAKLIYGTLIGSVSMVADGFHSLFDGASNIIGLVGISIAARPVDADHPYGHKKFETFTAVGIAMLLFLVAWNLLGSVRDRLLRPAAPAVTTASFVVMVVTMGVNLAVTTYETRRGRQLGSDILASDALHTRSDLLVSTSVIVGLAASRLGYPIVDSLAALVIAGLIAKSGITVVLRSARTLCDGAVLQARQIETLVSGMEGVRACHSVRTRGRADDIYVDLHIWVDPTMTVEEAHDLSHQIEASLKDHIPGISEVMTHVEPAAVSASAVTSDALRI
ncbi:MAG TPA: cation transporter [Firmicutes bacterium]|nr:cation transporter [Bacillota bacterium]